ncbi:hypothetical protein HOO65_040656 [Ceratocystis lukuohia]|uniref:Uncharacterized protein n=1 Tax=Ceratocystis lukuohia TaxID=2019550 RepID=A0ABR4MJD4_9PEZI
MLNHCATWLGELSKEDISKPANLSNAGIAPRDFGSNIRQSCNTLAAQQDISSRIPDIKRAVFKSQGSIHTLDSQLDKEGFWNRMQFDSHSWATAALFDPPDSLAYLHTSPDSLLLDCACKATEYGMPLLDITGVGACQPSFYIAFALLSGETEKSYI